MRLQERSYSSKVLRPKPSVHLEEDGSLLILATSWGSAEQTERVVAEIVNYISAAKSDVEVTSPYEFLTTLSDEANYVRTAILIANEVLYRGHNRTEYLVGLEITVLFKRGSQVAWAHVGGPHIFIQRHGRGLQAVSISSDLSSEYTDFRAPLPAKLIGLDRTCYVQCGSLSVTDSDRILLLGSSEISESLWNNPLSFDLQTASRILVQTNPDTPFWLGIVSLQKED